jgi:hypothetical protein
MVPPQLESSILEVLSVPAIFLMERYAVQTNMGDSKATAFGKHFITNFAPEILKAYLLQIDLYMNRKVWLSHRCVYLIVDFLEEWLASFSSLTF